MHPQPIHLLHRGAGFNPAQQDTVAFADELERGVGSDAQLPANGFGQDEPADFVYENSHPDQFTN